MVAIIVPGRFGPMVVGGTSSGGDTTTGLKSYWLMNDGSGTTVVDGTNSHNGTLTSSAIWNAGGWIDFNGTAVGRVTDHADFAPGSAITVFGWVKAAAQNGNVIVAQYDFGTVDRSWEVQTATAGSTNTLRTVISDSGAGTNKKVYEGSQVCFDGTWHSICVRFNSGTTDLFVDGTKDASVTKTLDDVFSSIANASCDLTFACQLSSNAATSQYTGALKKVRFYNVAKSDADIAAIHALGA